MLTANLPAAFGQSTPRSTVVGDGADPGDVEFVREAIALGKEAVETFSDGPITRQLSVVVRSGVSDRSTTFGLYDDDMIQIYTGSAGWTARSDLERTKGVLHEYAHFFLDPAPHPKQRPVWLEEGLAEFLAWRMLDDANLVSQAEVLAYHAGHIRIWPPGEQLCSLTPQSIGGVAYPLVHLGAAILLQDLPVSAVVRYRDSMAAGTPHSEAFSSAFLRSESEFCADVDRQIEALSPALSVPSELFVSESQVIGSHATIVDSPLTARPGQQVIVRGRTNESAECDLSLQHEGRTPESFQPRKARADGEGDIFWLITLPIDVEAGGARWIVSCGSGTDESPVTITLRRESVGMSGPDGG